MDVLKQKATVLREMEGDAAAESSSATAFTQELAQQLHAAETPRAAEQVLTHTRALWSPEASGGQLLLEAVCWDVLSVVAPFAAHSRGCQAAVAGACLDVANGCAPREAVTILLAAMGSSGEGEEMSWGLRLAVTEGLAAALPLIPRRRYETFQQAAPTLLAGLRAVAGDPPAGTSEGRDSTDDVERWAAGQYPAAVVALAHAVLATLQPAETQLQSALARFALQVLSISTAGLPLATPARPGSSSPEVPPLLLATLQLLPPAGLTPQRILRPDQEDLPGEPVCDSDEEDGPAVDEAAEVERERALAAACLLCLPAPLLPWPVPPLSPADRAAAVALAGVLLQGLPVPASKGLALIAAAAAAPAPQQDGSLQQELLDGVQATLQGLTMLMLLLPEPQARQAAYGAFKAGLSVLPPADRLSTLERFIDTCPHQPVVAVLLHLLKDEVARALPLPPSAGTPPAAPAAGLFPGERILAVVGRTLAPHGGAGGVVPQLPDEADVVVAALNLYRFLLLREAAVGRSWTGALSPAALVHARTQWLLPLRHAAAHAAAAVEQERQAEAEAARAAPAQPGEAGGPRGAAGGRQGGAELVATVQEVLHRVLELVEDRLQQGGKGDPG
ncbi:hypothetical protein KFL_007770020 [Klebsormidium nitens]|uniref:Uncharacterized protein n=1 Tax=Klebsormidium nitens TaxID=105231 RepID=A0A1Y1IQ84_KLENI|nr:hypothetical protein KFL_007770020 [Klebsormidium nitens]|eukprot:GAQ91391.1 hypothetical protein KFL_007770020 [Klebsormidium nitens]